MPDISAEQVSHLASLARIDLSPEEIDSLTSELGQIVQAVAQVQRVAGDDVPATSHPIPLTNVFRADEVRPSLSVDQALSGAPQRDGDRFVVSSILDEE